MPLGRQNKALHVRKLLCGVVTCVLITTSLPVFSTPIATWTEGNTGTWSSPDSALNWTFTPASATPIPQYYPNGTDVDVVIDGGTDANSAVEYNLV